MREFVFEGKNSRIVFPIQSNKNKNWIWRARFWGHEPQTDLALLERGFHLVYTDVSDLYGSPSAVDHWNEFYNFLIERYNLNDKVALEGMSRGGLIIYNWASRNAEKVACIYADAPVLDFKSWPGGVGIGPGSEKDWEKCLEAYGLSISESMIYKDLPIYNFKNLVNSGVPTIHVCGMADKIVPFAENTEIFRDRYKEAGGSITVIEKEGIGHHPHSLKDPQPIVDFILENCKVNTGN